jgi:hypothetical protein
MFAPVSAAIAADTNTEHGAFSILFENDLFYKSDRDYTSGEAFAYTTAADETPGAFVDIARAMPFLFGPGEARASYELGQDIFTPIATEVPNPPLTQRPYGGWLWLGLGLLTKSAQGLNQLQLQLGVTGPASLAGNAQIFVHSIIGQPKPLGWHYQLRDEPTVQFTYDAAYKLIPPRSFLGAVFDLEPHIGAAAGNVYDYVNAGAMARVGVNLPDDFGPQRLEPALPGSNFFEATGGFSAYVFAGLDARAIARNLFLDGNTFEDSRHVEKEPFVGDLSLGAAVAIDGMRLSFTHVFRTREYKTQLQSDQFGSINLTFQT